MSPQMDSKTFPIEDRGLMQLAIVRPEYLRDLSSAVFFGDGSALAILEAVHQSSQRIQRQARRKPVLCLCCPRAVRDPCAVLAFLIPMTGVPKIAIASALCARCGSEPDDTLDEMATSAFVKACPGLRHVEITHPEGGRA